MASFTPLHDWNVTPEEAVSLQRELASRVRIVPLDRPVETIAGCDVSFDRGSDVVYAGVVVVRLSDMTTIAEAGAVAEATMPYVPGLLSFRETPALLQAWEKLPMEPDAVMLDGQGLAHPRRMGIACHFGLMVERPTLGCAKSVLVGRYEEPGEKRGDWSPMVHRKETVGAALRTRDRVSPVYVSPGHRIDLPGAIDLALRCGGGTRIPEPTRRAHLYVNALRKGERKTS